MQLSNRACRPICMAIPCSTVAITSDRLKVRQDEAPRSKLRAIRRRRIIPPPESMTDGVGRDRGMNGETGMHRNGGSPFNARDVREKRDGREHRVGQNPDLRVAQVLPVSPVTLVYEE